MIPERMKIEKVEKVVVNLYDKGEYVIHIRNLKQALNHRLRKKVHWVIKFNQVKTIHRYTHRLEKKGEKWFSIFAPANK